MMDVSGVKHHTARGEARRALIQKRALERGQQRSDDVRKRVRAALRTIEEELAGLQGIYPHNRGILSSAEVARRAGVHPTTFFSPRQRELGVEVKLWLNAIKTPRVTDSGPARRKIAERLAEWKRMFDGLAQSHVDTELALQQAQAELALANQELQSLSRENERLRKLLSAGDGAKAVPMSLGEKG